MWRLFDPSIKIHAKKKKAKIINSFKEKKIFFSNHLNLSVKYTVCANIILFLLLFYYFFFKITYHLSRRLAKRDRKELELIDHSISSRLKRHRGDGKRDDDSGD